MQRSKYDLWVGFFVLLGIASIVFLALKVGNLVNFSFEKNYVFQAQFSNIGGVSAGSPIKSAGVVVGRVQSVALDNSNHQAVATIGIESQYAFTVDSSLNIMTAGLLGEEYIAITSGVEGETIEKAAQAANGKLLLTRTQPSVSIGETLSQIMPGSDGNQPLVGHTYFVNARFTNLGTIKAGSAVKSAGVLVGRVRTVSMHPQTFEAVLSIEIESGYEFPSDSSLRIMSSGLIGAQYIDVSPGFEDQSMEVATLAAFKSTGSYLTLSNTQSAFILEDLIGQVLFSMAEGAGSKSKDKEAEKKD